MQLDNKGVVQVTTGIGKTVGGANHNHMTCFGHMIVAVKTIFTLHIKILKISENMIKTLVLVIGRFLTCMLMLQGEITDWF